MIEIILHVLAIIGIVLLCLLGLLLLLVLAVLFIPVRYEARGRKDSELWFKLHASWLLHILSVTYIAPKPGNIKLRIFGIPVYDSSRPPKRRSPKASPDPAPTGEVHTQVSSLPGSNTKAGPAGTSCADDTAKSGTSEAATPRETADKPLHALSEPSQARDKQTGKLPFWKRLYLRIKEIIAKIKYTIRSLCDKIKRIAENHEYYVSLIREEETKLLFRKCGGRFYKVLKSIRPRKIEAELVAGTGSPDTTGYLLAVYGMLLPYLGNTVRITPDFENAVLEGHFRIRGRVTVLVLFVTMMRLYFDKQLRVFIGRLKREDK